MTPALFLICAVAACAGTVLALWGGWTSRTKTTILGLDPKGIGFSVLAVIAAVVLFGPVFGVALIAVVIIHEFGHVAAFRVAGHHDASFRLIPLLGGYAISDRAVDTPEQDVFITLMGPAICLAPMLLAYALVPISALVYPPAIDPLVTFASICGALNFFNLLPIWPLDGGRLTETITSAFHQRAPLVILWISTALIGLLAILSQSIFMLIFVAMGAQHLIQTKGSNGRSGNRRMSTNTSLLCLGAWLFTAAALFMGGISTILRFIS